MVLQTILPQLYSSVTILGLLSLTTLPLTPSVSLGGAEAPVFSILIAGNTQLTLLYAIIIYFEVHAVTVTRSVKLHIVVIYCLPGQLGNFLGALDVLLSLFLVDDSPLVVFGDFSIHLEKP